MPTPPPRINNNASNQDFTINADGFTLGAGVTERKITVTGSDITLTGSGTNTYTMPVSSDLLLGASNNLSDVSDTIVACANIGAVDMVSDQSIAGNKTFTTSVISSSTSTGVTLYNTSDEVTNYESGTLAWNSNVLTLNTANGGSGVIRNIELQTGSNSSVLLTETPTSGNAFVNISNSTTSIAGSYTASVTGTFTASSSTNVGLAIQPTINQSSGAGYTALLVNSTETATGSGVNSLLLAQVGGANKFSVNNKGTVVLYGGLIVHRTTVSDAPYSALLTDHIIAYVTLTASRTVTLPSASSAAAGQEYIIKDETGNAGTDNIVVATTGGQVIDGASTKTINANYGVLRVYSNGSEWFTY